jgi:hypothetical protein
MNSISLVAVGYGVLLVGIAVYERMRTRRGGPDAVTVFVGVFLVQCCLAPLVAYAVLPLTNAGAPTGIEFFDNVYRGLSGLEAGLVLVMAAWFIIAFYFGTALGATAWRRIGSGSSNPSIGLRLVVYEWWLVGLIVLGLGVSVFSLYLLGGDWLTRYASLVLYRAGWEGVERTTLNANAFALTQTWSWLSVVVLLVEYERRGWTWRLGVLALVLVAFAILGVSRRAIFVPLLLIYFGALLATKRWRLMWLVVAILPLIAWLALGKEVIGAVAYRRAASEVVGSAVDAWPSSLLRAASDIGITNVESVASFRYLDHMGVRFGVDHVLSLAQRLRFQALGFHSDFPERIVRISTRAFAGDAAQDIPPGVFGQMWFDFRMAGPLIWGLLLGLQVSVVQALWKRLRRDWSSSVIVTVIVFVIALPLNSGSYDFTFSIDIFALAAALASACRVRPLLSGVRPTFSPERSGS